MYLLLPSDWLLLVSIKVFYFCMLILYLATLLIYHIFYNFALDCLGFFKYIYNRIRYRWMSFYLFFSSPYAYNCLFLCNCTELISWLIWWVLLSSIPIFSRKASKASYLSKKLANFILVLYCLLLFHIF